MNAVRANSRLGDVSAWRRVRPAARAEQNALALTQSPQPEKRARESAPEPRARATGVFATNAWRAVAVEIAAPRGLRADECVKAEWRKAYAEAAALSTRRMRPQMDARA